MYVTHARRCWAWWSWEEAAGQFREQTRGRLALPSVPTKYGTYQLMTNSPTYLPPSQPLVLPPPNVNINVTTLQAALAESLEREQQARGTRLLKG